jgi:hypothetical protein
MLVKSTREASPGKGDHFLTRICQTFTCNVALRHDLLCNCLCKFFGALAFESSKGTAEKRPRPKLSADVAGGSAFGESRVAVLSTARLDAPLDRAFDEAASLRSDVDCRHFRARTLCRAADALFEGRDIVLRDLRDVRVVG